MTHWKLIEAVLFASSKYTSIEDIMAYTDLNRKQVKEGLKKLTEHYNTINSSLNVYEDAEGYKLNVKEQYSQVVQNVVYDAELPKHIMETLSLIAYKTPVLQSEIIKRRGQHAYDHISYLEKKKFVKKEPEGRSYKLKVTDKFHEYFDLNEPGLRDLFKNVKEPEELGDLEVYETSEEKDEFDTQMLERLKKAEKLKPEDEKEYLNEFDQKINKVKERVDKAEEEQPDDSETEDNQNNEENPQNSEQKEKTDDSKDSLQKEDTKKEDNFLDEINKDIDELTNQQKNNEESKN